jgi:four helix bundle protein
MVKRVDDLIAYQQAKAFRLAVYSIVRAHPAALFDAAVGGESNLAEGWRRFGHPDMIRFYRYAMGSLEEAQVRLLDGVDRGFFTRPACADALRHAKRSSSATAALIKSLEP